MIFTGEAKRRKKYKKKGILEFYDLSASRNYTKLNDRYKTKTRTTSCGLLTFANSVFQRNHCEQSHLWAVFLKEFCNSSRVSNITAWLQPHFMLLNYVHAAQEGTRSSSPPRNCGLSLFSSFKAYYWSIGHRMSREPELCLEIILPAMSHRWTQ